MTTYPRQLGRWKTSDPPHPIGAKPGAYLSAPVSDADTPRRSATHVHVHLPARTRDQALTRADPSGGLPEARMEQNVEPPEAGFRDRGIRLTGRDQEGRNWNATIYGPGGAGYQAEQHDPDALTTARDANAGGPGETEPGKGFETAMAKAIAPSGRAHDNTPAGIRGLAELMRSHYARRS